MKFSCRTEIQMKCSLCGQNVSSQEADEERVIISFVGNTVYGKCPSCHRSAINSKDTEWQRAVRMWLYKNKNIVVRV